jgi:prepilin-type N-terminal cleavage/methylation domain-containing protein
MKNIKAFTLIELLVAMAIIAILIGMSVFGVSQGLRASRDTQRRVLVDELQKGITVYQGQFYSTPGNVTPQTPNDGETVIEIGQGSKTVEVPFGYNVYLTNDENVEFETDEAYFCFTTSTAQSEAGYALGVKLETGEWFYKTSDTCF